MFLNPHVSETDFQYLSGIEETDKERKLDMARKEFYRLQDNKVDLMEEVEDEVYRTH